MLRSWLAPRAAGTILAAALLASCARDPYVVNRTACPAVAVLQHAGQATLFREGADLAQRDARDIDLVASITNVRAACADGEGDIASTVSFDVQAVRADATRARTVDLPIFLAVVRGGDQLVAKQLTAVRLEFAAGQARAETRGGGRAVIAASAAGLPVDVARRIQRERRPGDIDAAVDPLSEPSVREAVRRASFEVLVGFQLSTEALAFNALR
ncbi:MAG: hypothetical protein ACK40H_03165 [Sphingomonadaceae bacterium]